MIDVMTELEELRAEVRAYREAFTAMQYAKEIERFHLVDGLKDDLCPACGSPVRLVEGPEYPGELSAHGTEIGQATVRLKPRYGRAA